MPTYVYRSLVVLLFSVTMLCTVPTVIAATVTVFAQEPQQGGIGVGSDLAPTNSVFQQIGDNFQISHDTEVVSVRWWGVYFGDNVVSDDFKIRFFLNSGAGLPYTYPIFSVPAPAVTRTLAGFQNASSWDVYEYVVQLPAPYAVSASSLRYLSIVNNTPDGNWIWHASDPNPSFFRKSFDPPDSQPWVQASNPDLAFRLSEKAILGPKFELFVKEFLDANPPLPPPVELELFYTGSEISEANGTPSRRRDSDVVAIANG